MIIAIIYAPHASRLLVMAVAGRRSAPLRLYAACEECAVDVFVHALRRRRRSCVNRGRLSKGLCGGGGDGH